MRLCRLYGGNITSKEIYPYTNPDLSVSGAPSQTISYSYGDSEWKDLLTSYAGQPITYDSIGNPLSYRGNTLTWNGRQLASLTNGSSSISYTYDASGLRSSKTVNGVRYEYYYVGDLLMYEKRGSDVELYYRYDSAGNLASIRYINGDSDNNYYVFCTSRGDVDRIVNAAGELKAKYTYDSWGNVISVTNANGNQITNPSKIGLANPIRYRGYYLDSETGLYYLQSRYYDPVVGRFISVDGLVSTGTSLLGHNMFAYCDNNPANNLDLGGSICKNTMTLMTDSGYVTPKMKANELINNTIFEPNKKLNEYDNFNVKIDLTTVQSKSYFSDIRVTKEYSKQAFDKLNESKLIMNCGDSKVGYTVMSAKHIYCELRVHQIAVEKLSSIDAIYQRAYIADINIDESRFYVCVPMKIIELVEWDYEY